MSGFMPGIPTGVAQLCHFERDGRDEPGYDKGRHFPASSAACL